ncbi:MAG: NAD(P)-dependent alcohol dehydrogenase [Deltaproteobacteria bacterium]|nr:NAD(P)-dependent alcohol dehydrogenase [Deltaproteobacteria bacterium]
MTVLAALLREYGKPLQIEEVELEKPRADEILVRMVASGVCHTDISMINTADRVPLPIVLGHEGAGVVEAVGEVVGELEPGNHIVLSYGFCGHCPSCVQGSPYHCDHMHRLNFGGSRLDGTSPISQKGDIIHGMFFAQSSFATHAIVPARSAVKVPKDIPLELLAPLGCGVQTGAGTVFHIFQAPIGSSIAIFGSGSVGLSAVMAAKIAGCREIIAIDLFESRLQLASDLGATHVINPQKENVVDRIRGITGSGVDFAFDNTGNGEVIQEAFACLGRKGQCAIAAGFGVELKLSAFEILLGKRIQGVTEGESIPRLFIPQMIELYRQGRFPFDRLIKTYGFRDVNKAIEASKSGEVVKPVLTF